MLDILILEDCMAFSLFVRMFIICYCVTELIEMTLEWYYLFIYFLVALAMGSAQQYSKWMSGGVSKLFPISNILDIPFFIFC